MSGKMAATNPASNSQVSNVAGQEGGSDEQQISIREHPMGAPNEIWDQIWDEVFQSQIVVVSDETFTTQSPIVEAYLRNGRTALMPLARLPMNATLHPRIRYYITNNARLSTKSSPSTINAVGLVNTKASKRLGRLDYQRKFYASTPWPIRHGKDVFGCIWNNQGTKGIWFDCKRDILLFNSGDALAKFTECRRSTFDLSRRIYTRHLRPREHRALSRNFFGVETIAIRGPNPPLLLHGFSMARDLILFMHLKTVFFERVTPRDSEEYQNHPHILFLGAVDETEEEMFRREFSMYYEALSQDIGVSVNAPEIVFVDHDEMNRMASEEILPEPQDAGGLNLPPLSPAQILQNEAWKRRQERQRCWDEWGRVISRSHHPGRYTRHKEREGFFCGPGNRITDLTNEEEVNAFPTYFWDDKRVRWVTQEQETREKFLVILCCLIISVATVLGVHRALQNIANGK
jgi:hypothetical protein